MKRIPLKTVQMSLRGQQVPVTLDYGKQLLNVLEKPPDRGFTPGEMRARLPIGDRLEAAQEANQDYVLLEDAQHKKLADLLAIYPFSISHYALLEFIDAVTDAPDVEVEVKEER